MASLPDDCNIIAPCSTTCDINKNIMVELPEDVMMLIFSKLDLVGFHCSSAVCKFWQSIAIAAKKLQQFHLQPQLPWAILSTLEGHHIDFFSFSQGKIFRFEVPEVDGHLCVGSDYGWLIMAGGGCYFLLNPFTRKFIELPPEDTLPGEGMFGKCIQKVMLLSPPGAATTNTVMDDCVVVAICGQLAFCRPEEETWTAFGTDYFGFQDIIVCGGKFYAITYLYELLLVEFSPHPKGTSCDITPPSKEELSIDIIPPSDEDLIFYSVRIMSLYLVESLGELLVVTRYVSSMTRKTLMFKIFKLDPKGRCWIKVEDLGNQMLFIGTNTVCSLLASDYPGFRGNCIYFRDDQSTPNVRVHGLVAFLFHLEDNSIEQIENPLSNCFWSPPTWFTPISW